MKKQMSELQKALVQKAAIARNQIGINKEAHKIMIYNRYGVESSTDLNEKQLADLIGVYVRKYDWKPKKSKKKRKYSKAKNPQVRMIFGLWTELYELGEVKDPSREALREWVRRMTKSDEQPDGCGDPDWLTPEQSQQLVESLKQWIARIK